MTVKPQTKSNDRAARPHRWMKNAAFCLMAFFLLVLHADAQGPVLAISPGSTIHSVAGTGVAGFSGDNGAAASAALATPFAMAADSAGNIFIADAQNHRVRRIDTQGNINTVDG